VPKTSTPLARLYLSSMPLSLSLPNSWIISHRDDPSLAIGPLFWRSTSSLCHWTTLATTFLRSTKALSTCAIL
jgi:hypothetical protein